MSFQVLPNWCKKLGISLFVTTTLLTAGDAFMDGFRAVPSGTHHYFRDFYGETLFNVLHILPTISLVIYILSKEKIEDDYINLLRLQSYQSTVLIFLFIALGFYIFNPLLEFSLDMVLSLFMVCFLIIFYFKKRYQL
nr:hypothetical protein [Allomuricauda sp.]|tara:strand:- start:172 stop:582 length:411 start_codon:yes stop_codon:yes gene_type:complete